MVRDLFRQKGFTVRRKPVGTLMRRKGLEALYQNQRRLNGILPIRSLSTCYAILPSLTSITWGRWMGHIPPGSRAMATVCVFGGRGGLGDGWGLARIHHDGCSMGSRRGGGGHGKLRTPGHHAYRSRQSVDQSCLYWIAQSPRYSKQYGQSGTRRENVFVGRLWRSDKFEEVYVHAYDTFAGARAGVARYFQFFNSRPPQSRLANPTPDHMYFQSPLHPREAYPKRMRSLIKWGQGAQRNGPTPRSSGPAFLNQWLWILMAIKPDPSLTATIL